MLPQNSMASNAFLRSARRLRRGFTLIELVVVVAILVVLSGLVLPKLDVFKLKANKGVAAANMAGVDRYIESFRVQRDLYPDRLDSLIEDGTTNLFSELEPQCLGIPAPATPHKLTTTTIASDDELRSLNRVGILTVEDHVVGGFPSNSGSVARVLANGSTVATLNAPADADAQNIMNSLYPPSGVLPAGKKVVAFGVGPLNEMIGDVLHTAPFYANADQTKYYTRFIALFEVDDGGGRARFLTTIGADGDQISEEIQDFYEN